MACSDRFKVLALSHQEPLERLLQLAAYSYSYFEMSQSGVSSDMTIT
jgi:hypothetical protein